LTLLVKPLLPQIAAQAPQADATRSVAPETIAAIKANDVMRMSASREIGGLEASIAAMGRELEAVAGACGSTGWCLWNHLCVYHFFCGLLGPGQIDALKSITGKREWVCLPGGASTAVKGTLDGSDVVLDGVAAFGSGCRYAEHIGVPFVKEGEKSPSFALVRSDQPGVRIDPTWRALSVRASATDHIYYEGARIPAANVISFHGRSRDLFRQPDFPVVNARYREDWVGLSGVWLGCMAVGVAQACLDEACDGIKDRIAIMGAKMVERPTIHVNLGQAGALIQAARDAVYAACDRTDARIAAGQIPGEGDYLDQIAGGMMAIKLCDDAMKLILRVLGGNGLREGVNFERRYRDFQAMPLHINTHPDRVTEQLGRHLLDLPTDAAF
jgi:alkylation response protein AidB-like acyl-CoA dehydrogenase